MKDKVLLKLVNITYFISLFLIGCFLYNQIFVLNAFNSVQSISMIVLIIFAYFLLDVKEKLSEKLVN